MKVQLDENTFNAYVNQAINEEIDEILGLNTRRQSKRMITGDTNENEECPQSLVGMVSKLEQCLVSLEGVANITVGNQNLAAGIEKRGWLGGFKMKKSLLNAIEALTQLSERLKRVERTLGMNQIMESVSEIIDPLLANGSWGSSYFQGDMGAAMLGGTRTAGGATAAKTGLMGKIGNGLRAVGKGLGTAGSWAVTPLKTGAAGVAGALTTPLAIAMAAFAVADAAAIAATNGRQRKIIRTYNCAAILAKRIGIVAQAVAKKQGTTQQQDVQQGTTQQEVNENIKEINVKRGKKTFASIEQGMNQLSVMMKQIYAQLNGQGQGQTEMPQSLNTRQEIEQFQNWANEHGYKDQDGLPLNPDGIWGKRTAYVYDQIAAANSNQTTSQDQTRGGVVNESRAVERALQNLEHSVGTTGTGGAAYADISRMSGGQNASRRQNAQNIKHIIRTYPPVLNQYQRILQQAGADVSGLQLLVVDQRPHRNYSVKEIEAIDQRIQELIAIAQEVQGIGPDGKQGQKEPVNLPPKPIVKRKPKPIKKTPAQQQTSRREVAQLPTVNNTLHKGAEVGQDQKAQIDAEMRQQAQQMVMSPDNVAKRAMAGSMANGSPAGVRQNYRAGKRNGATSDSTKTFKGGAVAGAKDVKRNGLPMNEQKFKNLVKETLLEMMK